MKYALFTAFALALGLSACGGTEPPPNAGGKDHCDHCKQGEPCEHCKEGKPCDCKHGDMAGHGMGGEPGGQHEAMKGPVGDFHAVLSPVYHADKGAERTKKVCEQAAAMHDKAALVESAPVSEGVKLDDYKVAAKNLTTAVDGLVAACAAAGRPDVDAKLEEVHGAFHKIIELPGVMPGMQTEHGEHGEHH